MISDVKKWTLNITNISSCPHLQPSPISGRPCGSGKSLFKSQARGDGGRSAEAQSFTDSLLMSVKSESTDVCK